MGMLCAVSFNRYGRLYYLDPGELTPAVGDRVLVPTDTGTEVAECVWAAQWVADDTSGFPRLAGLAGAGGRPAGVPGAGGAGGAGGRGAGRAGTAAQGRGQGGGEAADPGARPADEGRR